MMNPYPKSKAFKSPDPGLTAGVPKMPSIKSGPTVKQSFVKGRPGGGKTMTSPGFATKTSNPRAKNRGGAKIAQGGEKESSPSSTGLSRTNKGRQRL